MHLQRPRRVSARAACLLLAPLCAALAAGAQTAPSDIVFKNATVMTASHGTIEHGSVWVHAGKIAGVGAAVSAPSSATVIDATGLWLTPGIIDPHSHSALDSDINEATSPVTPSMHMIDAFAPGSIKFASGENPKRVYGSRDQLPSTRMGNFEVMRMAFEDAKHYMADWDSYDAKVKKGDKDAVAPKRDLKLEALADVLRGKLYVQIHCYRADEFLTEEAIAHEYGYKIRAFHHALEMYKVGEKIAADQTAIATFSDWWGFKDEARDAIPWNAVLSMREGVKVALKSDSDDHIRRLNQEAGKMIHYGGATEDEAIRMVTLNPAWIIGVDDRTGSIDAGKDADLVLWNHDPLSTYARAQKVYIDGDLFFDATLPGLGTTHFNGVMHDGGGFGNDDEEDGQ